MTLSSDQLDILMICGRFNFPASKCIIKLEINRTQASEFIQLFEDHSSDIRQAYEKGKIETEFEIMEKLVAKVEDGKEGADEAAKALNSMRKYQALNEHLNEVFGL